MAVTQKVIVAVDKSKASPAALSWALENFDTEGTEIHLVHIVASEEQTEGAQQLFRRKFSRQLEESGVSYVEDIVVDNNLVHDVAAVTSANICRRAKELDAKAVVVGQNEHGFFRKLLLNSVSKRVLSDCPVPVTVITLQDDVKYGSCPV